MFTLILIFTFQISPESANRSTYTREGLVEVGVQTTSNRASDETSVETDDQASVVLNTLVNMSNEPDNETYDGSDCSSYLHVNARTSVCSNDSDYIIVGDLNGGIKAGTATDNSKKAEDEISIESIKFNANTADTLVTDTAQPTSEKTDNEINVNSTIFTRISNEPAKKDLEYSDSSSCGSVNCKLGTSVGSNYSAFSTVVQFNTDAKAGTTTNTNTNIDETIGTTSNIRRESRHDNTYNNHFNNARIRGEPDLKRDADADTTFPPILGSVGQSKCVSSSVDTYEAEGTNRKSRKRNGHAQKRRKRSQSRHRKLYITMGRSLFYN